MTLHFLAAKQPMSGRMVHCVHHGTGISHYHVQHTDSLSQIRELRKLDVESQ